MGAAMYAATFARASASLFLGLSASEASTAEPCIEAGQHARPMGGFSSSYR